MKPISWDGGWHFDDPNLRWGDPSYVLEPGDPGYVPPPGQSEPTLPRKRQKGHMKNSYIAAAHEAFGEQMRTFALNIPTYKVVLDLSADEVDGQAADSAYFTYLLAKADVMSKASKATNGWKDLVRYGGTVPPEGSPGAPVLPATVPEVAPGIEPRFRKLCAKIKLHKAYNEAIGRALGIEGSEAARMPAGQLQPKATLGIEGLKVVLKWEWNGARNHVDGVEIRGDHGDKMTYLCHDTTPGYIDGTPLPAVPTKWTYELIFTKGDGYVGQPLQISVLVGG